MKTIYNYICFIEELIVKISLLIVVILVFLSAIFRTIGTPINWATDIAQLVFGWAVFMGADMGIRENRLVRVDMILEKFPLKTQKVLDIIFSVLAIIFLLILIRYGSILCIENVKRQFSNITISYSWATASVPCGATLMIISLVIKLTKNLRSLNEKKDLIGGVK